MATPSVTKVVLTGGIASGKSVISTYLKAQNVPTIDADDITHQLLSNNDEVKQSIKEAFVDEIINPDGSIHRQNLAQIVFNDPLQRKKLEKILHPPVRQAIYSFFEEHHDTPVAVAVIPLLFETGSLVDWFDVVWLVYATQDQQIDRLMTHRGYTEEQAMARIHSQLPMDEKLEKVKTCARHAVIDNTGRLESTQKQVSQLLNDFLT